MALPRLVRAFRDEGCFTLDEALRVTGTDRASTLKEIDYLRRSGYVESIRQELYALRPDGPAAGPAPDPYVVASKVTRPYLLGYHTALELHGVAQSAFHDALYVLSPARFRPFAFDGLRYRRVRCDVDALAFAVRNVKRSGTDVRVADPELTVVQCADRPRYAGGFDEVVDSTGSLPYLDWDHLLRLLEVHGKTVLYRKVGYLVDHHRDRWQPPSEVLDALAGRLGEGSTYFGTAPHRGGRLVPDWQVIVPGTREGPDLG